MWLINMIRKWLAKRRPVDERLERRYNTAIAEFGRTLARFDRSCREMQQKCQIAPAKTEKNGV